MDQPRECLCCGKAFEPTCHVSRQKYCSRACCVKYNNARRYVPPGNACLHCGASLEQSLQRGRNRKFCGDVCRNAYHGQKLAEKKRAAHNAPRICPNCGREFRAAWETGMPPRFCSDECRVEWWREYHKTHVNPDEPLKNCAYCGRELEIRGRKYCSRVCYRLGAARARGERICPVCGKLLPKKAHSGRKYCSQACATAAWSLNNRPDGPRRRCITTGNPGAWRRQLAELARNSAPEPKKDRRIYLICGTAKLVSTDALVNFVRYQLQCDPFDGNVYVFCNGECTHLKWLEWDGSGFCIGARQTEWGRYPWPGEKSGAAIEITEQEFEFLRCRSNRGNEGWNR